MGSRWSFGESEREIPKPKTQIPNPNDQIPNPRKTLHSRVGIWGLGFGFWALSCAAMARTRLIGGIAFAALGLALLEGPSQGFSQNAPAARAVPSAAITQIAPEAAETQAAMTKY